MELIKITLGFAIIIAFATFAAIIMYTTTIRSFIMDDPIIEQVDSTTIVNQ